MQKHKGKSQLEVTTLTWDYSAKYSDAIPFRYDKDEPKGCQQYLILPEHPCPCPLRCGLFFSKVKIFVGNDGRGACQILHYGPSRSKTDHERDTFGKILSRVFTDGETIHVDAITLICFNKRNGEPLTDTAIEIYRKLLSVFGVEDPRDAKGPSVTYKNYAWSSDLQGWAAFEDRLAQKHGLKPINAPKNGSDQRPFETFHWPPR